MTEEPIGRAEAHATAWERQRRGKGEVARSGDEPNPVGRAEAQARAWDRQRRRKGEVAPGADEPNLLRAIWERHASRAALWRALCLCSSALTALALVLCLRLLNRPREVIRIGCDGIPQLVRLDTEQYTEPNEREMQAFVRIWTVAYARSDSFSAVNDAVHAARYMVPELRDLYRRRMRGTAERPGLLAQLEAVGRRTEIDPNRLEVEIDRQQYPWVARVRGERRVVVGGQTDSQPFALEVRLVRAPREQVLEGLLVQEVRDVDVVPGGGGR